MSGWRKTTVGEVCDINPESYSSSENWKKFKYLDTGNITRGKIEAIQDIETVDDLPSRARRKAKRGDIVYSTVRPIQRHYGILENPEPNLLVSTGFAVIRGRINVSNTNYIYYYLTQGAVVDKLQTLAESSVSAYPSIRANDISSLTLHLPNCEEQGKIASSLKSLDDKIALNRKMNETLERMARALFQSWFVDFDPVKAKQAAGRHGRDPEKACMAALSGRFRIPPGKPKPETLSAQLPAPAQLDTAIATLDTLTEAQHHQLTQTAAHFPDTFQLSALGLMPKRWKIENLNYFSNLNARSWTTKKHPENVHYIDLSNCKNGYILLVSEFSWKDAPSRALRVLKSGDTIVGTVRPGNRSFALIRDSEDQLTGSTGFAVLTPLKEHYREFVYLHACGDESIARLTHLADGAAYPAVRPDMVSSYEVVCPPDDLISAFSASVSKCFNLRNSNERQSHTLAELRDTLLPKLLSGELPVGEVEDTVTAMAES